MFFYLANFFFLFLPVLVSVAFITLLERKILGLVGFRLGPSKVSVGGFLQPISDALKLSNKTANSMSSFSALFYYCSSIFMLSCSLSLWILIFLDPNIISLKFSLILVMIILGLNSLMSIFCGWSTFGKYPLIGSLRTLSQLISYEASLYMIFFFFCYFFSSFSFSYFYMEGSIFFLMLCPVCLIFWCPSVIAELNRSPFDFSEGESELVSGFNTEFGCSCFTLLFLAEYSNILFFCFLTSFMFFCPLLILSFLFFVYSIIWIRCVLPRFRFDKLMMLCWKLYIPIISLYLMMLICYFF